MMDRYMEELTVLYSILQGVAGAYRRSDVDVIVDLQELAWMGIEEQEARREWEALRVPSGVGSWKWRDA